MTPDDLNADEIGAPQPTAWMRAWAWLETHLPDRTADLGTDDEDQP